jgi:hypothetical protein
MDNEKSLITYIAEAYDHYRIDQREAIATQSQRTRSFQRILRWLIPNGGTLLIVAVLLLTQSLWARPFQATMNAPGPSATTVNYQGRLAESDGTPINNTVGMSFALWDAATEGNIVWGPESHDAVSVSEGLFSVGLGSKTTGGIPTTTWNGDRYLEITVGGETLAPRELIRSVPIAGMALTVPDGAIKGQHLAAGLGASNKPLLNFVPTDSQRVIRLENQSDIDTTELDLSSYVSSTATRVMIWAFITDSDGIATLRFPDFFNLRNFSTSTWTHDHIVVPLDSNQTIQYKLDAKGSNSTSFEIRVIGYWEPVNTQ